MKFRFLALAVVFGLGLSAFFVAPQQASAATTATQRCTIPNMAGAKGYSFTMKKNEYRTVGYWSPAFRTQQRKAFLSPINRPMKVTVTVSRNSMQATMQCGAIK